MSLPQYWVGLEHSLFAFLNLFRISGFGFRIYLFHRPDPAGSKLAVPFPADLCPFPSSK